MFLDVTDECVDINIHIDTLDTTTSRSWAIHVKQFTCGDTNAGPTGCLQYHTGTAGDIATFNWDLSGTDTSVFATTTHLANQNYDICFRREEGYCRQCYSPKFATSFGVGLAAADMMSAAGKSCYNPNNDYIEIPGAQQYATDGSAHSSSSEFKEKTAATYGDSRICGQYFTNMDATTSEITVCSKLLHFFKTLHIYIIFFS